MAMVILNPTDEDIEVNWAGIGHILKPDIRQTFDEKDGKQIMHNYKDRGLVELNYGDEGAIEVEKIKEGRHKYDEFWTRQCVNYNQLNEERQQGNRPFIRPREEIFHHAKRLGIKLLEPYKLEDTASRELQALIEQNKTLEKEIGKKDTALAGLQGQVADLTANFKKFMSLAGAGANTNTENESAPETDIHLDPDTISATIARMHKKQFAGWMAKNWDEIASYPDDVRKVVADKHLNLYGTEFPTDRPAIEAAA